MKQLKSKLFANEKGFVLPLALSIISVALILILSMTITYESEVKYLDSAKKNYKYNSMKLWALKKALLRPDVSEQTFVYSNDNVVTVNMLSVESDEVKCTVELTIDGMAQKNTVIYNKNQKRIISWVEM